LSTKSFRTSEKAAAKTATLGSISHTASVVTEGRDRNAYARTIPANCQPLLSGDTMERETYQAESARREFS
jgi:hypothetical protein